MDGIDAGHLEETLSTQGWAHYFLRLTEAIRDQQKRLETLDDTAEIHRCQGFLNGLRRAQQLPEILLAEARKRGASEE